MEKQQITPIVEKQDLFETPEKLEWPMQNLLMSYALMPETYENCESLLSKCKKLGYTFEYGLDAIPYNLQKLTPTT